MLFLGAEEKEITGGARKKKKRERGSGSEGPQLNWRRIMNGLEKKGGE